jgi:NAD-dependent deacetylase
MLRPAVLWFGESLPEHELRKAVDCVQQAGVVLVVGTSAMVYPAAALPRMALGCGARVIEVNPEPTELSQDVSLFLQGKASAILPGLAPPAPPQR